MWLWEGTDAMYMFKSWEEDYLECYRYLISVWSGSGTWERGEGKPNLVDCVLKNSSQHRSVKRRLLEILSFFLKQINKLIKGEIASILFIDLKTLESF